MKKDIFVLNEERELLILTSLGLVPIMPIVVFIFSLIYWFLLFAVMWIVIFVIIYLHYYSRIIIDNDTFIIKTFKKTYSISTDNIFCLVETKNINYINNVRFSFKLKKNFGIPKRFLVIQNKKITKMIKTKTLDISVISKIIM